MAKRLLQLENAFFQLLKKKGRSENTLKNYRTDIECFNQYLFGLNPDFDIKNFNLTEMKDYGNYLQEKYTSDNSRRRRVQALRIFFDFLVGEEVVSGNPVREVPTSPKFLDIPRPTPFIEVKALWTHLLIKTKEKSELEKLTLLRNQLVILFIYGAGLKVSDLANLRREHIFIDKLGPRVMISHPKRDPYTIPLPPIFEEIYKNYTPLLESKKKETLLLFNHVLFNANPHKILSGGLSPRGLELVLEDLRKKLKISLTPKSLRQACIFKWMTQSKAEGLIKEWLGVAPSYSLKGYREYKKEYIYNETFLSDLYHYYNKGN
ncbi:MAG: site-specific integrase [Bacteriovoracaceae bacterium]|nr:site-specific integrase [Bacteriovoracaceae bacterium]